MTDELLALVTTDAAERGVRLYSLCELQAGGWRACFIDTKTRDASGHGAGDDPIAAVRSALNNVPPLPKLAAPVSLSAPRPVQDFAAEIDAIVDAETLADDDIFG